MRSGGRDAKKIKSKSESEGGQSSPSDSVLGGIVAMWIEELFPLIP